MTTRLLIGCALILLVTAPGAGAAGYLQQQSFGVWQSEDACAREAFHRYPDYTPEGNAKRNEEMRRCLERRQLPPRSDLARQPTPKQSSGSSTQR